MQNETIDPTGSYYLVQEIIHRIMEAKEHADWTDPPCSPGQPLTEALISIIDANMFYQRRLYVAGHLEENQLSEPITALLAAL